MNNPGKNPDHLEMVLRYCTRGILSYLCNILLRVKRLKAIMTEGELERQAKCGIRIIQRKCKFTMGFSTLAGETFYLPPQKWKQVRNCRCIAVMHCNHTCKTVYVETCPTISPKVLSQPQLFKWQNRVPSLSCLSKVLKIQRAGRSFLLLVCKN